MSAMDKLLYACIIFFIIDLSFVGTTTYFVVKLVKRLLREKTLLDEIIRMLKRIGRD